MTGGSSAHYTVVAIEGLPLIHPGDDLAAVIADAVSQAGDRLEDGDVLVVAQKVVSKAEGRFVALNKVQPSARASSIAAELGKDPRLVEVILSESVSIIRSAHGMLITENRLGLVMANAGVDMSNVGQTDHGEFALLLPIDPDASADRLREGLRRKTGTSVGVIVNDSAGRAWRLGVTSIAIGVSGIPSLADLRGLPDLFGNPLKNTRVAFSDLIACAANLVMGEAAEGLPVVRIRGLRATLGQYRAGDLLRPAQDDLFR